MTVKSKVERQKQSDESVLKKKIFLKIAQNSQESTSTGVSFFFPVSFAKFLGTPPVAASGKTKATTRQKGRDKKPKKRYEIE